MKKPAQAPDQIKLFGGLHKQRRRFFRRADVAHQSNANATGARHHRETEAELYERSRSAEGIGKNRDDQRR